MGAEARPMEKRDGCDTKAWLCSQGDTECDCGAMRHCTRTSLESEMNGGAPRWPATAGITKSMAHATHGGARADPANMHSAFMWRVSAKIIEDMRPAIAKRGKRRRRRREQGGGEIEQGEEGKEDDETGTNLEGGGVGQAATMAMAHREEASWQSPSLSRCHCSVAVAPLRCCSCLRTRTRSLRFVRDHGRRFSHRPGSTRDDFTC